MFDSSRPGRGTVQPSTRLCLASFALLVSLHCNVYDPSLLENAEPLAGGGASAGRPGSSGTAGRISATSGAAGESELGGGGGLIGLAGANEVGGTDASAGTAGNVDMIAGTGGVIAGAGGAIGGAGGSAAAGGAGDAGGTGGAGGAIQTASGCAKLSVPLDDTSDKAHFVISLNSPADLSSAAISMRVYVQAGQGGTIFNYVQDSGTYRFLGAAERRLLSSVSNWTTLNWNVGAEPDAAGTGIVKSNIKNIGIELNVQPSTSWSNPTIVYIDSLTVTTPNLAFTFDATTTVYTTPTATNASGQALWLNNGATDTTAAGATLSWQATCP
jgi:hypothetical protein